MKACHLTTAHPPFDIRIFYKDCKTLVKAGYDVSLIAQHDKNEIVNGVQIIALPKAKNRPHRMFVLTLKAFWFALKQEADIYHFHDPELLPVGVLLKLFTNKKIVYDVHEDYTKQIPFKLYLPKIVRTSIAFLVGVIEYLSLKLFDGVITATDNILENVSCHGIAISIKNFPIASWYDTETRSQDDKGDVFKLVCVGNLTEARGITQIVGALELINSNKQGKLILCGKFYPTDYEATVRGLKGFEKVEYLGWLDPCDIPKLLKECNAGVACLHPLPNHITALPTKLFEYMAAGLPVIASNFPLWKEIVEGNRCGLTVDPSNTAEMTKAIEYLIEHPELCKEMGENGRKAVLENYNWRKESVKLLNMYEDLLGMENRKR